MDPENESGELSFVAQTGHVGTAKHLLKKGEVGAKDKLGELWFGARTRHVGTAEHLVKKGEVGAKDKLGREVLSSPTKIERDFESGYSHKKHKHETSLEIISASGRGDLDTIKRLVEEDVSMDAWCINRALVPAAEGGHLNVVKYLVENCGQLDKFVQRRALRRAAERGHLDVVKYLVENVGKVDEVGTDMCNFTHV